MLNKLFRPKWQHENPDVRKAAIARFTGNDSETLTTLALNDDQSDIRQLAISKIEKLEQLENIAANSKTRADQDFAHQCWVSRLIEDKNQHDLEQWIVDCNDQQQLLRIIAFSHDDNLNELALSGMQDDTHLLQLLQQSKNAKVWRTIVSKLQQEASLKQALDLIKGKDKKTQQQLKARLNEIHQQQAREQAQQVKAEEFLQKLIKLEEYPQNPQFEGILLNAQQQWQSLQNEITDADSSRDISEQLQKCEAIFSQAQQLQAEQAAAAERVQQDSAARTALLDQLQQLQDNISSDQLEDLQQQLQGIAEQWQTLNNETPSSNQPLFEKRHKTASDLIEAFQRLQTLPELPLETGKLSYGKLKQQQKQLQQQLTTLSWPKQAQQPDRVIELNSQLEQIKQQLQQLNQNADTLSQQIRSWIDEADQLIEKDELQQARKLVNKVRPALASLPEQKSKQFNAAFQRINGAVRSLEDWKDYATDPKREALCEEMQKLIDADIPATNLADAIKQLQKDWKKLGHCHDQSLWQRFQELADQAYLPCKAFYADQKKQRAYNAEQRTIICQQLEDFIQQQDWQQCDWKALDKLHKATQQEWQRFAPVAKEKHKALQDRFYTSLNQIRDKLNAERQRNTDIMQQLVDQAKALAELEDSRQAIDSYQQLHKQWKQLGISFHKQQHQLWQELHSAGEALYQQRRSNYEAADNERQQNLENAEQLCSQIETLSSSDAAAKRADFDNLKQAFAAIGSLPRDRFKAVQKRFNSACEQYEKTLKTQQQQAWLSRFDILTETTAQWLDQESNGNNTAAEQIPESLDGKWKQALQQRCSQNINPELEQQARNTCIEMEILAEIESPQEDRSQRMELQMQKLTAGLGQTDNQARSRIEQLYLQWFALPCWQQKTHQQLQQRFLSAASKACSKL